MLPQGEGGVMGKCIYCGYDATSLCCRAGIDIAALRAEVEDIKRGNTNMFIERFIEREALRARIALLEKVVIDVDEAMRGDYHREGTKIRIVVTQESLNRFRAALDALKEGKG
jgi:hypothetical protein